MPTRFRDLSAIGRAPGFNPTDRRSAGTVSDPYIRQYVIALNSPNSTDQQGTGLFLPPGAVLFTLAPLARVTEVTGATATISVGTTSDPEAIVPILSGINANAPGLQVPLAPGASPILSDFPGTPEEIVYTYDAAAAPGKVELLMSIIGLDV